jgi:hypothetical protein
MDSDLIILERGRRRSVDEAVHLIASFPFEHTAFDRTERRLGAPKIEVWER